MVHLLPYPSCSPQVYLDRIREVHAHRPIDLLIPNLDAELPLCIV